MGSSPRMRGTRGILSRGSPTYGIIPAYAGNTMAYHRSPRARWDHPRVCGEHWTFRWSRPCFPGSSPRMRGTQACRIKEFAATGIIPAYAGNTTPRGVVWRMSRDHPRVCGEHKDELDKQTKKQGSSPRMRGTLDGKTYSCKKYGIIPAYAGNTLTWQ